MDQISKQVARFLEALQIGREQLRPLHKELIARGAKSPSEIFILSARPFYVGDPETVREYFGAFVFGVNALQLDGRAMEFLASVLWDNDQWTIQTEVWVDSENNQDLIHSFPEKQAQTLDECLMHFNAAINDLYSCASMFNGNG